jgi:hypothetical protein
MQPINGGIENLVIVHWLYPAGCRLARNLPPARA